MSLTAHYLARHSIERTLMGGVAEIPVPFEEYCQTPNLE